MDFTIQSLIYKTKVGKIKHDPFIEGEEVRGVFVCFFHGQSVKIFSLWQHPPKINHILQFPIKDWSDRDRVNDLT